MNRLERLVAMSLFLAARKRVRAEDVAEKFSISLRTVYRDVHALTTAGFPIEGTAGDGYRVTQDAFLRPLQLTTREAEALTVAANVVAASSDARFREALTLATAKLEAALDRATRRRVRALERQVVVTTFAKKSGPVDLVLESLREQKVARVTYEDLRGRETSRDVEPLGLVYLGDGWVLVAYCRLRKDARAFAVERFRSFEKMAESYVPRDGFSFADVIERERKNEGLLVRS